MDSAIPVDIDSLRETTQQQRTLNREGRLRDYKIARDELFTLLTGDVQSKMTEASKNGSYRAILFTGRRQDDGMYPPELFFGKGSDADSKGIPFPSVWNPRGIPEEESLITKLRRSFQTEMNQNLRFYVKRDLRDQQTFHVFVDWSPRREFNTREGGVVRTIRGGSRRGGRGGRAVVSQDGFTTVNRRGNRAPRKEEN
jgi:ribosomal protein L17